MTWIKDTYMNVKGEEDIVKTERDGFLTGVATQNRSYLR